MQRRVAQIALFAALLLACSPVARVRTEFRLPGALRGPSSKLHVAFAAASTPGAVVTPAPALGPPSGAGYAVEESSRGFVVELTLHGRSHYVMLVGWFDSNANAKVDSGDAVGRLSGPVLAEDRGLFRGNLTEAPPITLSLVP